MLQVLSFAERAAARSAAGGETRELRDRVGRLEAENGRLRLAAAEHDQLQAAVGELQGALEQVRAEAESERERLVAGRARLAAALAKLREELSDAERNVAELTERVAELTEHARWSGRQIAALVENEAMAEAALARKDKALAILRARARGLVAMVRSLREGGDADGADADGADAGPLGALSVAGD